MRTSVGPLPAAVYWRRRALVLGAVLLGVLVLFMSCSGDEQPSDLRGAGAEQPLTTSATQVSPTPDATPSFEDAAPGGPVLPDPSAVLAEPTAEPTATVAVAPDGRCTDQQVSVTPVPVRNRVKRGTPVELRLKIKNTSARPCARDVGADLQEIYIKQGARKIWSSDTCGTAKGSDLQQLLPNRERDYGVTWNGRAATKCAAGSAVGPLPVTGEYQVFGRLGGKVSAPVTITVVA
ncbi:MAG TPA: adhesin [Actinoplanes sp.]|nr:adhesin [Actinoplanes sp.]